MRNLHVLVVLSALLGCDDSDGAGASGFRVADAAVSDGSRVADAAVSDGSRVADAAVSDGSRADDAVASDTSPAGDAVDGTDLDYELTTAIKSCGWESVCPSMRGPGDDCFGELFGRTFKAMLAGEYEAVWAKRRCISQARDCDDVEACRSAAMRRPESRFETVVSGPCDDDERVRCDGDVRVTCRDDTEHRLDCDSFGATCDSPNRHLRPQCHLDAPNPRCVDDVLVFAEPYSDYSSNFWIQDCAAVGMVCDPEFFCIAPERIPCEPGEDRCHSTYYVEKCHRGLAGRYDCRTVHPDFECIDTFDALIETSKARCAIPDDEREPCVPGCDGPVFTTCEHGVKIEVDCAEFGAFCDSSGASRCRLPE